MPPRNHPILSQSCRLPPEIITIIVEVYMVARWTDLQDRRGVETKKHNEAARARKVVVDMDERSRIFRGRMTDFTVIPLLLTCNYISSLALPFLYRRVMIHRPRQAESFLRHPRPSSYHHILTLNAEYAYFGQPKKRWNKRKDKAVQALAARLADHERQEGTVGMCKCRSSAKKGMTTVGGAGAMMPLELVNVLNMQQVFTAIETISPMSKMFLRGINTLAAGRCTRHMVDHCSKTSPDPDSGYFNSVTVTSGWNGPVRTAYAPLEPLQVVVSLFFPVAYPDLQITRREREFRHERNKNHLACILYLLSTNFDMWQQRPSPLWTVVYQVNLGEGEPVGTCSADRVCFDDWTESIGPAGTVSKLQYLHRLLRRDPSSKICFVSPGEEAKSTTTTNEHGVVGMTHLFCDQKPMHGRVMFGRRIGRRACHGRCAGLERSAEMQGLLKCLGFSKTTTEEELAKTIACERERVMAQRPPDVWQLWMRDMGPITNELIEDVIIE